MWRKPANGVIIICGGSVMAWRIGKSARASRFMKSSSQYVWRSNRRCVASSGENETIMAAGYNGFGEQRQLSVSAKAMKSSGEEISITAAKIGDGIFESREACNGVEENK
jgi:hypothetical protein